MQIHILFLSFQSEGQSIIFLSVNLSYTHIAVTLHEAEFFDTAEHTEVARPSLCVKLIHAIFKVIVYNGTKSICADTVHQHHLAC